MPLEKLNAFTKKVSDLSDKPNETMTTEQVKAHFDAAPEELRVYLNKLIDMLQSTATGDSGADNIKMTPIETSPDNVQGALLWLKNQISIAQVGQLTDGSITDNILSGAAGQLKQRFSAHTADGSVHKQGNNVSQTGLNSNAEGNSTTAHGENAHAEGESSVAVGMNAHVEGVGTLSVPGKHYTIQTVSNDYMILEEDVSEFEPGDTIYLVGTTGYVNIGRNIKNTIDSVDTTLRKINLTDPIDSESLYFIEYVIRQDDTVLHEQQNSHAEGTHTMSIGFNSHAEGRSTIAGDECTHAEGYKTIALSVASHAEGLITKAIGGGSHAEGQMTVAEGNHSHAEGFQSKSIGIGSHAEGCSTRAEKEYSHSEGYITVASGEYSHAEGGASIAAGHSSHAEGQSSRALAPASHAEGMETTAEGFYAHSSGYGTHAGVVASFVAGRFNNHLTGASNQINNTDDAFVIGNGSNDGTTITTGNAFRVTFNGKVYGLNAFNSTGADYAEYFEWLDKNVSDEDRVGYFVTLDGDKIRKANADDDYILGIVSANPSVVGDSYQDDWKDKYITDDWGRIQYKYVHVDERVEEIKMPDGEIKRVIHPARTDYVPIINPDWRNLEEYTPREQRKEWDAVGIVGKLLVRDDGTCQVNGYCKPNNSGIATASETGYRVMERVSDNIIRVFVKG